MGDKSPKDKNKKQTQRTAADDRAKREKQKQQVAFDKTPNKPK